MILAKSVLTGIDQFELTAEKMFRLLTQYRAEVGRKALEKYASTAGRYAVPNMGWTKIEERFYTRKIDYLPKTVKSARRNKYRILDLYKLHQGFLFRIVVRPPGEGLNRQSDTPLYFKTLAEAKAHEVIVRRGYLKFSFGTGLEQWGAKRPNWIRKLADLRPALNRTNAEQQVLLTDEDDVLHGVMTNIVMPKNTSFARIAAQKAESAVGKLLQKECKKIESLDWDFG